MTLVDMASILGDDRRDEIKAALDGLVEGFDKPGSGLRVQKLAGGYRITTNPELAPFVREMVRTRNRKRLSRAALETLAVTGTRLPDRSNSLHASTVLDATIIEARNDSNILDLLSDVPGVHVYSPRGAGQGQPKV